MTDNLYLFSCRLLRFPSSFIVCACPYSSNIGLSAMTLYYPVQDQLVRDLLTYKITTQKYNKPKIIIFLSKTKEPIRVLYSDNVTRVKHKYKP